MVSLGSGIHRSAQEFIGSETPRLRCTPKGAYGNTALRSGQGSGQGSGEGFSEGF